MLGLLVNNRLIVQFWRNESYTVSIRIQNRPESPEQPYHSHISETDILHHPTMSNRTKTQQPPAPTLSTAHREHDTTDSSNGSRGLVASCWQHLLAGSKGFQDPMVFKKICSIHQENEAKASFLALDMCLPCCQSRRRTSENNRAIQVLAFHITNGEQEGVHVANRTDPHTPVQASDLTEQSTYAQGSRRSVRMIKVGDGNEGTLPKEARRRFPPHYLQRHLLHDSLPQYPKLLCRKN